MSHHRYVVRNSQTGQFIGSRRFTYSEGKQAGRAASEDTARIWTRRSDAEYACPDATWEVLPVTVTLCAVRGEIIDP